MKSSYQIKTDVYKALQNTALARSINGVITKRLRPLNSVYEDICIKVVSNEDVGDNTQEAVVYVNIYVPDLTENGQSTQDDKRTGELESLASACLEYHNGGDHLWRLQSQVVEDTGAKCHVICNKLRYKQNND